MFADEADHADRQQDAAERQQPKRQDAERETAICTRRFLDARQFADGFGENLKARFLLIGQLRTGSIGLVGEFAQLFLQSRLIVILEVLLSGVLHAYQTSR